MAYSKNQRIAWRMYKLGMNQKDIAELLEVSENTISRWASEFDWKQKRIEHELRDESIKENAFAILANMLKALREQQEKAMADGKSPIIDKGDIDAAQKMHTIIRQPLESYEMVIKITREFLSFAHDKDLAVAKTMVELTNDFLHAKRKLYGL